MTRDSKGLYKKGHAGNPKGRSGSPNRITKMGRERIIKLLDNNWQKIQEDLDSLEPKDRLNFLEKMMSYTIPKLSMVKGDFDIKGTGAETLTSAELTQFIVQVTKPKL